MEIVVNPLVNWVWVGFGILALGTGIALLPDTVFAFARREDSGERGDDIAAAAVAAAVAGGGDRAERQQNVPR